MPLEIVEQVKLKISFLLLLQLARAGCMVVLGQLKRRSLSRSIHTGLNTVINAAKEQFTYVPV